MAQKEKVTVQVRIADIRESRFFIQHSTEVTAENIRQEASYQIQADTAVVDETENVAIIFDVRLILKKKPDVVLMHFVSTMSYELAGFEMSHGDANKASIPTEVMQMLVAAAYSTCRGLVYARCGESILRHAIMPLHDPMVFLKSHKTIKAPLVAKNSRLEE